MANINTNNNFAVGSKFFSYQEFQQKLKEYEKDKCTQFVIAQAEKVGKGDLLLESFQYRVLRYRCKQGPRKHESTCRQLRPNQRTFKLGCQVQLNVRLNCPKNQAPFLRITKLVEDHSGHDATEEEFRLYPEQRRIEIDEVDKMVLSATALQWAAKKDILDKRHGGVLKRYDVYNLKKKFERLSEAAGSEIEVHFDGNYLDLSSQPIQSKKTDSSQPVLELEECVPDETAAYLEIADTDETHQAMVPNVTSAQLPSHPTPAWNEISTQTHWNEISTQTHWNKISTQTHPNESSTKTHQDESCTQTHRNEISTQTHPNESNPQKQSVDKLSPSIAGAVWDLGLFIRDVLPRADLMSFVMDLSTGKEHPENVNFWDLKNKINSLVQACQSCGKGSAGDNAATVTCAIDGVDGKHSPSKTVVTKQEKITSSENRSKKRKLNDK